MKTKLMMSMLVFGALTAFAAPPPLVGKPAETGPAKWGAERAERMEAREREARLMYVVAISEALELGEADALKLSEKIKGLEERRRPVRQAMGEAMRGLDITWKPDNVSSGLLQIRYPRPVAPHVEGSWRGVLRYIFEVTQATGRIEKSHHTPAGNTLQYLVAW